MVPPLRPGYDRGRGRGRAPLRGSGRRPLWTRASPPSRATPRRLAPAPCCASAQVGVQGGG
eukprot:7199487-Pyramimonas_sp.AAC.1